VPVTLGEASRLSRAELYRACDEASPRSALLQQSRDMKLRADRCVIAPEKLRDYVLAADHPEGGGKAKYLGLLGYSRSDWQMLEADLRTQHLSLEATVGKPSAYGQKYEILGPLRGPNGATGWIRTVWIVPTGDERPKFVTLIPEQEP